MIYGIVTRYHTEVKCGAHLCGKVHVQFVHQIILHLI